MINHQLLVMLFSYLVMKNLLMYSIRKKQISFPHIDVMTASLIRNQKVRDTYLVNLKAKTDEQLP